MKQAAEKIGDHQGARRSGLAYDGVDFFETWGSDFDVHLLFLAWYFGVYKIHIVALRHFPNHGRYALRVGRPGAARPPCAAEIRARNQ